MKEDTLEQMLDTLAAEGRVRRLAQRDCADLPLWGRLRERRADRLRYALAACLALALAVPAGLLVNRGLPSEAMASAGYDRAEALHTATLIIS